MAIERPLKINTTTGEIERFSATDTVQDSNTITSTNNTGVAIPICTPVYQTGVADEIAEAVATATATARVFGLAAETIANAASGGVQTAGRIVATTGEWDAVTGQVGGLTPGAKYWLDTTVGLLTTTPPSADTEVIAPIGTAKNTTEFIIDIDRIVVL